MKSQDGITSVRYLPGGRAMLNVIFNGVNRSTKITWQRADEAVKRDRVLAFDEHVKEGLA